MEIYRLHSKHKLVLLTSKILVHMVPSTTKETLVSEYGLVYTLVLPGWTNTMARNLVERLAKLVQQTSQCGKTSPAN